jgi:hypothetical protein
LHLESKCDFACPKHLCTHPVTLFHYPIRSFKVGDVALFLPTRNSTGKPWAAFNINAPHYFLKPTDNIITQMTTREWIVARITSINENVVDSQVGFHLV